MSKTLYSPRLSDDVVRLLYQEGRRRRKPMTTLADEILRSALADNAGTETVNPAEAPNPNVVPFPDAA